MDGGDIPDDFFDELSDIKYDTAAPNGSPNASGSGGDSPQLARCLAEIDELQKKIQRRKRKLERDLTATKSPETKVSRDRDRDRERDRRGRDHRSRSVSPVRRGRNGTDNNSRRRSPDRHSRHRNNNRGRSRSRSRSGRGGPSNRNHSPGGKRASSNHKSLSFLEELAQTFAERGQDFPEKDLIMQPQGGQMHAAAAMQNMNIYYPGLQQQYQNAAAVTTGFPMQQPDSYYGINPMAMHGDPLGGMPPAMQNVNNLHEIPANFGACAFLDDSLERSAEAEVLGKELNSGLGAVESTMEAISVRCAGAIKLLRAEENKVPKQRFVFTRTVSCRFEDNQILSPLESRHNPSFRLNSSKQSTVQINDGIKSLPPQTAAMIHVLGLNSAYIFAKLRAKEIAEEIDVEVNRKESADAEVQTTPIVCDECEVRSRKEFINRGTQAFEQEKVAISVQTDDEEFREPLGQMMARLSSAQLKAVRDFATLLVQPQPQNNTEMSLLHDQIVDTYHLAWGSARSSSRGSDGYRGRSRANDDMDQRFILHPFNSGRGMRDMDHGGGGSGSRRNQDYDIRGGPAMDDDFRQDDRFRGPALDMDQRRNVDFLEERRILEERERERLRFLAEEDERLRLLELEEEHLRHQEMIQREDMERERLRLLTEEAERREHERRFELDLMEFNQDSPERGGGGGRQFNNQWTRGDGGRRSRGAWKARGRGRGR